MNEYVTPILSGNESEALLLVKPFDSFLVAPGGFGDSLSQMFGFGYPVYGFGLQLRLPIRNRAASADLADALVAKKRDMLSVRTVQQQVRLDILQAVSQVRPSPRRRRAGRGRSPRDRR